MPFEFNYRTLDDVKDDVRSLSLELNWQDVRPIPERDNWFEHVCNSFMRRGGQRIIGESAN